jgi:hypothetical protein
MRLDELTGVKSQKDKTASQILIDILNKDHNIKVANGVFGVILINDAWDYVVKFFAKDNCYLKFVEYAIDNPNNCFPKFKRKPICMTAFFKTEEEKLDIKEIKKFYAVKIEKLKPLNSVWKDKLEYPMQDFNSNRFMQEFIDGGSKQFEKSNLRSLYYAVAELYEIKGNCNIDLHDANIMLRRESPVIVDPFANFKDSITLEEILGDSNISSDVNRKTLDTIASKFED